MGAGFGDQSAAIGPNYFLDMFPLTKLSREYRDGLREAFAAWPANVYAVANFEDSSVTPTFCHDRLGHFDALMARVLNGRKWSRKPAAERLSWVAIPERATFLHYNMLWAVPPDSLWSFFETAETTWEHVMPKGSFHRQLILPTAEDHERVAGYITKAFHSRWSVDNLVLSQEFHLKQ
jgi:hypothetical protein